jgi:DNA-directed RNA polymerase specialized sigma24 family protein
MFHSKSRPNNGANRIYEYAPGTTDHSQIRQAKLGDKEALRTLIELYSPLICTWCRKRDRSFDENELLADIWHKVYYGLQRFEHHTSPAKGTFRNWLSKCTQSTIAENRRQRHGHGRAVGGSTAQEQLASIADRYIDTTTAVRDDENDDGLTEVERLAAVLEGVIVRIRKTFRRPEYVDAFIAVRVNGWSVKEFVNGTSLQGGHVHNGIGRVATKLEKEIRSLVKYDSKASGQDLFDELLQVLPQIEEAVRKDTPDALRRLELPATEVLTYGELR